MQLTFTAYDESAALHTHPGACAFTLLTRSLNEATDPPAGADKWLAWKQLARIRSALDPITESRSATVVQDGQPREVSYAALTLAGGTVPLDRADFDIWEAAFLKWVAKQPASIAREVDATFRWLEEQKAAASTDGALVGAVP